MPLSSLGNVKPTRKSLRVVAVLIGLAALFVGLTQGWLRRPRPKETPLSRNTTPPQSVAAIDGAQTSTLMTAASESAPRNVRVETPPTRVPPQFVLPASARLASELVNRGNATAL